MTVRTKISTETIRNFREGGGEVWEWRNTNTIISQAADESF